MAAELGSTHRLAAAAWPWGLWQRLRARAADARQRLPWLWYGGWAALVLSLPLAGLAVVDDRMLQGVSVWSKPWKFHVSIAIHLLTLAWLATYLRPTPQRARAFGRLSAVALVCAVFELAYITWRAARGEPSHFNIGTPLAGAMYTLMGMGAVALTGCAGMLGLWLARAADFAHGPLLQRGLALGLLLGCVLGTLTGAYVSAQPGHAVGGLAGDGAALPVLHWSLQFGDLRVAHFVGLHAMQVLPLAAWLAAQCCATHAAMRTASMHTLHALAAGHVALTVLTFAHALRGQPFF
jgi:hypothetical protein